MKTFEEVKDYLRKTYLESGISSRGTGSLSVAMDEVMEKIEEFSEEHHEDIVKLEESIGKGFDFRSYFKDEESIHKLSELYNTDKDKFYKVLHCEEMFLNTCCMMMGMNNMLISFDPKIFLDDDLDLSEDPNF